MSELGIVTIIDAAERLGITPDTLRHACQPVHGRMGDEQQAIAKRLKARKIGRDWYIDEDALLDELQRRDEAAVR